VARWPQKEELQKSHMVFIPEERCQQICQSEFWDRVRKGPNDMV